MDIEASMTDPVFSQEIIDRRCRFMQSRLSYCLGKLQTAQVKIDKLFNEYNHNCPYILTNPNSQAPNTS